MSKTHEADAAETQEQRDHEARQLAGQPQPAPAPLSEAEQAKAAEAKAAGDRKLKAYLTPFGVGVNPLHPFEDMPEDTVCELIIGNILHGPTSLAAVRAFAELVTTPEPPPPEALSANNSRSTKGV